MNVSLERCLLNYLNGNLRDAKEQAKRFSARRLCHGAMEFLEKPRHVAALIANYLKNPSQQTWDYLCQHDK